MKHYHPKFELCLPYKGAVTYNEEVVTDIAAYSCNYSDHYRHSKVTAL